MILPLQRVKLPLPSRKGKILRPQRQARGTTEPCAQGTSWMVHGSSIDPLSFCGIGGIVVGDTLLFSDTGTWKCGVFILQGAAVQPERNSVGFVWVGFSRHSGPQSFRMEWLRSSCRSHMLLHQSLVIKPAPASLNAWNLDSMTLPHACSCESNASISIHRRFRKVAVPPPPLACSFKGGDQARRANWWAGLLDTLHHCLILYCASHLVCVLWACRFSTTARANTNGWRPRWSAYLSKPGTQWLRK